MTRPIWVDVDLAAFSFNLRKIKEITGKAVTVTAVLKQFAYGHGLIPVARQLYQLGVNSLGVGSIEEAVALREDGYRDKIILLSAVSPDLAPYFIRYQITPTLVDEGFACQLNNQAKKTGKSIPVHIKVDTGMGRLGFYPDQIISFLEKIIRLKHIFLEGIYTHLPVADTNSSFTKEQLKTFQNLINRLKAKKINFKYCHSANSLGLVNYPQAHFNMVRPGLILYGIKPAPNIKINLKPALSFKSKVIFSKEVPRGKTVGYGADFVAKTKKNIATVAAGYADGYPWALSNQAQVLIKGEFFKVAGRVCMDHIMVDLGKRKDIGPGEIVTLIGKDKEKEIKAEDLAAWAKTIPYEIATGISQNIPRFYLNG